MSASPRYWPSSFAAFEYAQTRPLRLVLGMSAHALSASARFCHFEVWTVWATPLMDVLPTVMQAAEVVLP